MTDLQQRYARLLRAYPAAYREQRGEEILATLLETSPPGSRRPPVRDGADLVLHGVQMRLGLTSERFGGRVLDTAATPGLVAAAMFSAFFFVYAELFPFVNRSYGLTSVFVDGRYHVVSQPHFGAFSTTGVVMYLAWVIAAVGALAKPSSRRTLAALAIGVTVASVIVGKLFFAAPRLPLMLALIVLALPAILAPTTEYSRHRVVVSSIVGGSLVGVLWWPSRIVIQHEVTGFDVHSYGSLYALSVYNLGHVALFVGGVVLVGTLTLVAVRRSADAGALALLGAPWLILTYAYHVQSGDDVVGTAVILALPVLWVLVAWMVDMAIRPSSRLLGRAEPAA